MISLDLNMLKPGMVLAKPVHNFQGILLLNKGAELTKKNILILKSWGVTSASIKSKGEKKKDNGGKSEKKINKFIEKELQEKFSEVLEDEVMVEIMRVAKKQLEKRHLNKEKQNEIH